MLRLIPHMFSLATILIIAASQNHVFAQTRANEPTREGMDAMDAMDAPGETERVSDVSQPGISGDRTNDIEVPDIIRDVSVLPFPAKRMRQLILEATRSGDIEKLRDLIGTGESATQLSLERIDGDMIAFLKQQSGDDEGHEILAILEEILEAGFVHLDAGTPNEIFIWPYFFAYPIEQLTPVQRVELFRIVTYGDYVDMQNFGGYIFYRVGINPSGRWQFFVAGD